jgi:hypothetical protein
MGSSNATISKRSGTKLRSWHFFNIEVKQTRLIPEIRKIEARKNETKNNWIEAKQTELSKAYQNGENDEVYFKSTVVHSTLSPGATQAPEK